MRECDFLTYSLTLENSFEKEECQEIIRLYNSEQAGPLLSPENNYPDFKRKNIYTSENTGWIFKKLGKIIETFNNKSYNFTLFKMNDYLQVFKIQENDSFDWRKDLGTGENSTRKLSIILFLSPQNEFEGGEMKWFITSIYNEPKKENIQRQGNMIIFPSYLPYRMDLMTKGEKYCLTTWALGPHFY